MIARCPLRATEIRNRRRAQPCRLLRIHLSDGSSCEIAQPAPAYVAAGQLIIAPELSADEPPDRLVYCDPLHVTRIEAMSGTTGAI